ncbi:hypothetical protein [Streptomyces sp. NPDC001404]|uniref:hypothetical protein n=1 Tax=Streptomyces sp. NPDC001404 TaxID=3364571 RepID=UPI0036C40282
MVTMPESVTPTRIIPAGQPLPPSARPLPPAPPGATDLPPWRTAAPPPAPPAFPPPPQAAPTPPPPTAGPLEVRVVIDAAPTDSEPEERGFRWGWLWPHVRPFQTFTGGVVALLPIPWTGYSTATTWAYTVHEARGFGIPVAYGLGLGAFAAAWSAERRATGVLRQLIARAALVITFIGVLGAIDFYDPVTALTGVHRR